MIINLFGHERPPVVGPVRLADAPALAVIHAKGFERGWDTTEFERLLTDRTVIAHAARPGGRGVPTGFCLSRILMDEAEILTVAVAPSARGRGLGKIILKAHFGMVAAQGAKAIFLEVAEDNVPAVRLYRSFGFADIGQRKGYYARKGGEPATALVMRRALV